MTNTSRQDVSTDMSALSPSSWSAPLGRSESRRAARILATLVLAGVAAVVTAAPAAAAGGIARMYDIDGNGRLDPGVRDTNRDGWLDQNVVVSAGRLIWLFDQNQDSLVDQYGADGTGDGRVDLWFLDNNQDGRIDETRYDTASYPSYVRPIDIRGRSLTIAASPWTPGDTVRAGLRLDPCAATAWTLPDSLRCVRR
jgi:hypothetical protein